MAATTGDKANSSSILMVLRCKLPSFRNAIDILGSILLVSFVPLLFLVLWLGLYQKAIPHLAVSSCTLLLSNKTSSSWDLTVSFKAPYIRADALLFHARGGGHQLLLWNASLPPVYNPVGATLTFTSRQVRGQQPILADDAHAREMLDEWRRLGAVVFQLRFSMWSEERVYSATCGDVTLGFRRLEDQDLGIGGEAGSLWAGPLSGPPVVCPADEVGKPLLAKLFT